MLEILNERIIEGESILKSLNANFNSTIPDDFIFKQIRFDKGYDRYDIWNDYNFTYINTHFENTHYAKEYQETIVFELSWRESKQIDFKINNLKKTINTKINYLIKLKNRLEIITQKKNISNNQLIQYENEEDISSEIEIETNLYIEQENRMNNIPKNIKYAIITALEAHEMEKVLSIINREGAVENEKHLIEYGHLKSDSNIKIAYASQQAMGMVDASILATEMIILFKPKFLIMAGVLGGKPKDVNIGDVVIATKVFTIDKGKHDKLGFHREIEVSNITNSFITKIIREKTNISRYIEDTVKTRKTKIEIHFGPIGCVRQVIDLEGFFKENIEEVDRKAIALEMESYGITRACELVNNGKTIPLIIKAAMDNTVDKLEDSKPFAAWNSAMFVKYILENNLI